MLHIAEVKNLLCFLSLMLSSMSLLIRVLWSFGFLRKFYQLKPLQKDTIDISGII